MNDQGLSRKALLIIAATGLVTALLALLVTHLVVGSAQPTYRATTQVALVPAPTVPAEQVPSYWESLAGGQAATIGAEVLKQTQWLAPAAQAANVAPADVTVTAAATASTSLITVTVTTTSPQGAEAAATALVQAATPTVQQVSGPYILQVAQPAAGTAVSASIPESQLLMVVFAGGLFVGAGVALVVARSRGRREEPAAAEQAPARRVPPPPGGPMNGKGNLAPAGVPANVQPGPGNNGPGSNGPGGPTSTSGAPKGGPGPNNGPNNGPGGGPGNGPHGGPGGGQGGGPGNSGPKSGGPGSSGAKNGGPGNGAPANGPGNGKPGTPARQPGAYTPRGSSSS
ncbi:hypothetical protein [Pseudonocardia sp. N23]|uniref:hypothetical protein n=1 Tax=Pseudonocardia sp. N23 TaxID=1987376 RepID=UPI000BFB1F33|nr:hypothetical protein [Pseudonocardia sp. N23]GAY12223.1 hypothetical protein TOK_0615 [Pseudonocardia sp. N23]